MYAQGLHQHLVLALALLLPLPVHAADLRVPDDHATIAAAIAATPDTGAHRILIAPGTYAETGLTLKSNLTLLGDETARTFISGGGAGTLLIADGISGAIVRNLSLIDAATGIAVRNNAGLAIENNVFVLGSSATAVNMETSQTSGIVDITHNSFFGNGTAVNATDAATLVNNIFADNVTAVAPASLAASAVSFNGFFNNSTDGQTGTNAVLAADPLFVNTGARDFHLRADSPAIDASTGTDVIDGTQADLGAYGGSQADTAPYPVSGLSATVLSDTSISLSWSSNPGYRVSGYKLYYDSDQSGAPYNGSDAAEGSSPITVGNVTTYTLTGLTPATTATLTAPVLQALEPSARTLTLRWSAVPEASGYVVHWGQNSTSANSQLLPASSTEYALTNLENGTSYHVAVSAFSQASYFLNVTATDANGHESAALAANEAQVGLGAQSEGPLSNELLGIPETLVATPNLPDENCFIATAAYGHFDAAQVQRLRRFRDRYLLTHAPGRAFVAWYYRHGPVGARWLNRNETYKPLVRAALLPAVGLAGLATGQPGRESWLLLGTVLLAAGLRRRGRRA